MSDKEITLVSHLMRRAGFGATRTEIEELSEKSYEDIVEDLLHPERVEDLEEDVLKRYNIELSYHDAVQLWSGRWIWRMINSRRPLEEKMALFWHHVFATAWYKSEHSPTIINQIEMFRRVGMSDLRTILIELSKDPAMNYWLDNCENHAGQPNENWGRELLELFSMGVGNYTEDDIKNAARAFTGWTFKQPIPLYPFGHYESGFEYIPEDHDDSEKTFLGHTGNLNGEDIVDIIVQQEPTYRIPGSPPVQLLRGGRATGSGVNIEPPNNPEAIDTLVEAFKESNGDIKTALRTLFNSDFFKQAQFKKVKNPAELVAGTIKLVGTYDWLPAPGQSVGALSSATTVMGQALMNPRRSRAGTQATSG